MPIVAASSRALARWRLTPERDQLRAEEIANAASHGIGALCAAVGSVALVVQAFRTGDAVLAAACVVYGLSLTGVFVASAGSHWIAEPRRKRAWEIWDQAAIYLLIAGTYSPYAAVYLRDGWWPAFSALMWCAAMAGFVSKVVFRHRVRGICLWMYMALGWLPIVCLPTVFSRMEPTAVAMTVVGGLCYTVGAAFLACDHLAKYVHLCWHLLVLVGCGLHFAVVYGFVARIAS